MAFSHMTDKQVLAALGEKFDLLRRHQRLRDKDVIDEAEISSRVLAKHKSGENINLESFIRLVRAVGRLDLLESIYDVPNEYSPTGKSNEPPKRIRQSSKDDSDTFLWGEDK